MIAHFLVWVGYLIHGTEPTRLREASITYINTQPAKARRAA